MNNSLNSDHAIVSEIYPRALSDYSPESDSGCIKIMSFNLRFDTLSHPLMSENVRGPRILKLIEKYGAGIVGFQEATDTWMGFLRSEMKKLGFSYVGVGRDSGTDDTSARGTSNEFAPVFYKSDRFKFISGGNFWLSDEPDKPTGPAWGASNPRICTYAVLEEISSGKKFCHFNTHLDDASGLARTNGAELILNKTAEIFLREKVPFSISGDFNAFNTDPVYSAISGAAEDSAVAAERVIVNTFTYSDLLNPTEPVSPAILDGETDEPPIDFIFLNKGNFSVKTYTVVNDLFVDAKSNGKAVPYPYSDHFGIYAAVRLK